MNKIKTEPGNTLMDIAIFEYVQKENFSEPFKDLKPLNFFFTCDRNLFYYSKLGRPLIINLPNFTERLYYPDLSFLESDPKSLRIVRDYFRDSSPEDLKEHVLDLIVSDLGNYEVTQDALKFLKDVYQTDFTKVSVFQYAAKFKNF